MKNKYTFWLILLAVLSSSFAFSQTNPTNMVGAWQQKDTVGGKVVQFRNSSTSLGVTKVVTPATLKDSLKNYAQIQDGLISGGEATLGVGSVTIDTAVYRINKVQYTSIETTFSGIANSPSGTQYYLVVYGEIGGTLDTISGARDTIAVIPSIPANTVKVNTILVGDGGIESATPDLSGFAKLVGGNVFFDDQVMESNIIFKNESNGVQLNPGGWLSTFLINKGYDFAKGDFSKVGITGGPDYSSLGLWLYSDGTTGYKNSSPIYAHDFNGDINTNSAFRLNGTAYTVASNSTSGFLTSTNWNDFNNKQDALTNPITGTGTRTTNYVPKFSGTNTISNSQIFEDGLGNIGIGTISPPRKLSVTSAESEQIVLTSTNASNLAGIFFNPANTTFSSFVGGTGNSIVSYTNGSEKFRIAENGNVGIGITSPTSLLHVNGLARATGFGAGIAPSSNHYLTTAANTSTIGSWLWTPSSTDYTGTVSGTFYNNANELKFYDGTISGTNRLVKLRNNQSLAGSGTVGVISNNAGDISTVPIADRLISGEVQTSANRTLTLTDFGSNGSLTVYCTTSGGDVTITLPSPTDMRYLEVTIIKVTAGNNVIISGSANINGSASITESAQYKSYTLVSNGTQYYIKGERP